MSESSGEENLPDLDDLKSHLEDDDYQNVLISS